MLQDKIKNVIEYNGIKVFGADEVYHQYLMHEEK